MKRPPAGNGVKRLLSFSFIGLVAGSVLLAPCEVSARKSGRGSVKNSSTKKTGKSRSASGAHKKPNQSGKRKSSNRKSAHRSTHRRSSHRSHARYSSRSNARRDYRRWRAVTGVIKLGVVYSMRPKQPTTVVVTGTSYVYSGGVYYVPQNNGYVVVSAPPGAVVYAVPTYTTTVYVGTTPYYYSAGTYYVATTQPAPKPEEAPEEVSSGNEGDAPDVPDMTEDDHNYKVVAPPVGATVTYLPDEADEETIQGKTYFVYADTYYRPFASDGDTVYMVVEKPS